VESGGSVRSADSSGPTQSDKDFIVDDEKQSGDPDFLPTQSELDAASVSTGSSASSGSVSKISEIAAYVQESTDADKPKDIAQRKTWQTRESKLRQKLGAYRTQRMKTTRTAEQVKVEKKNMERGVTEEFAGFCDSVYDPPLALNFEEDHPYAVMEEANSRVVNLPEPEHRVMNASFKTQLAALVMKAQWLEKLEEKIAKYDSQVRDLEKQIASLEPARGTKKSLKRDYSEVEEAALTYTVDEPMADEPVDEGDGLAPPLKRFCSKMVDWVTPTSDWVMPTASGVGVAALMSWSGAVASAPFVLARLTNATLSFVGIL
jgi:hypothetical protein